MSSLSATASLLLPLVSSVQQRVMAADTMSVHYNGDNPTIENMKLQQVLGPVSDTDGKHLYVFTALNAKANWVMQVYNTAQSACQGISVNGQPGRLAEDVTQEQHSPHNSHGFAGIELPAGFLLGAVYGEKPGYEWAWASQPSVYFVKDSMKQNGYFAEPYTNPDFPDGTELMYTSSPSGVGSWTPIDAPDTRINRLVCQVILKPKLYLVNQARPVSADNGKRFLLYAIRDEMDVPRYTTDVSVQRSVCSKVTQGSSTGLRAMINTTDENGRMTFETEVSATANVGLGAYFKCTCTGCSCSSDGWYWDSGVQLYGTGSGGTYQAPLNLSSHLHAHDSGSASQLRLQFVHAQMKPWTGVDITKVTNDTVTHMACELTFPPDADLQLPVYTA